MKRLFLIYLFTFLFVGISLQAQINTQVNPDFEEKIHGWMEENNVPAVGIGIIKNGEVVYRNVFGEIKDGVQAKQNTVFGIASITKAVSSILVLKLVEAGQWNLDEPLYHYWIDPDVVNDTLHKKLTTRHILMHQSGFKNWRRQYEDNKLAFDFEPGTKTQYSGEAFEYLQNALEKKFNTPFQELMDSIVFNPLKMDDSRLYWDKHMDSTLFAYWHDSKGKLYNINSPKDKGIKNVSAAASMLTTVDDLCKLGIYIINGAGISPILFKEMVKPNLDLSPHHGFELGWGIVTGLPNNEYAIEHGGGSRGISANITLLPISKQGIVILTNGDNGSHVINNMISEYLAYGNTILEYVKGGVSHKSIILPNSLLNKYTGTFKDSYGRNITLTIEKHGLKLIGDGLPNVVLYPEDGNNFFLKDYDVQFQFEGEDFFTIIAGGKVDCTAKRIE